MWRSMTEPDKEVRFMVYDQETDEVIEMTMDADDYDAMVEYEKRLEFERHERRERLRKEEYRYGLRGDDY